MRRALATATIAGAIAFVPVTATIAIADDTHGTGPVVAQSETDQDEPALQDENDDTGKYGLLGLLGLAGLAKQKEHTDTARH